MLLIQRLLFSIPSSFLRKNVLVKKSGKCGSRSYKIVNEKKCFMFFLDNRKLIRKKKLHVSSVQRNPSPSKLFPDFRKILFQKCKVLETQTIF